MNGMVEGGRPGKSIKGAGCPCFLASSITIGIGIQQPLQFLESSQANPLRQRHTHPHKLTYLRKKMQFKLAAILALATAVAALPAAENSQPADGNDGVSILATRKWCVSPPPCLPPTHTFTTFTTSRSVWAHTKRFRD